jgi:hypothetical protein
MVFLRRVEVLVRARTNVPRRVIEKVRPLVVSVDAPPPSFVHRSFGSVHTSIFSVAPAFLIVASRPLLVAPSPFVVA